jgi:hypothetical protein
MTMSNSDAATAVAYSATAAAVAYSAATAAVNHTALPSLFQHLLPIIEGHQYRVLLTDSVMASRNKSIKEFIQ